MLAKMWEVDDEERRRAGARGLTGSNVIPGEIPNTIELLPSREDFRFALDVAVLGYDARTTQVRTRVGRIVLSAYANGIDKSEKSRLPGPGW